MAPRRRRDRSEPHIRTLIANSSEGFIVVDGNGLVRVFNEKASEMFSVARESAFGAPIEDACSGELATAVRLVLSDPEAERTIRFVSDHRYLGCKLAPVGDSTRDGIAIVVRDDTELFEQRERSEAILAGAGDGLVMFTPDSHVAFINPAAEELLGLEAGSVVGNKTSLSELLGRPASPRDDISACWEIKDCGNLGCPQRDSEDWRCWLRCGTPGPDGKPLPYREKAALCVSCEVHATNAPVLDDLGVQGVDEVEIESPEHRILEVRTNPVLDRAGRYLGCISTLHDVTAAREIAIMKNEFVSMVSHELRTPLTSIKGYVDLLVDGEAGEINEVQREFLEIVQENSDRLVSLINDLLDISRIESGRVHLRIEPLDPADIVSGVLDTFRTYAEQSGIALHSQIEADLPRIAADNDRVGQVLMNLTSNAIKYSPHGGDVTLSASRDDDFVVLGVTDTGIGIAEEDQHQLFTKFFRVDSSLTREIGGTGLGLSICKSVVELHGGSIWVTSTEGEGSTFAFRIPVAVDLVRTPAIEGPLVVGGGTVLVIDRDTQITDLIGTYLERRGYDVMKAHSASEALAIAQQRPPALITLDVMLDGGNGFELLQHLKEDPATADTPIVVLSIVTDEGKSLRLGAADYLEKPIDKSRLMKLIDDLIGAKVSPVVLVVDDDRHIVESLSHTLRAKGFAVAQAFDGHEAMRAIEAAPPDLVLLDLKMPEMDGYQVIQEVKSHARTEHIPIVVMTAHRIDHDRIDILKLAAEQIAKPFSPETLAERVEAVLGKGGESDGSDTGSR